MKNEKKNLNNKLNENEEEYPKNYIDKLAYAVIDESFELNEVLIKAHLGDDPFEELMDKLEKEEQDNPINGKLKKEIINFLNDTLIKDTPKENKS